MLFEPPDFGGQSAFVDAAGTIIWQADSSEQIKTVDMTVVPITRRPRVDAGDVQTIRLPTDRVTLSGYAVADADALSTHWSMESGPASATFGDAASLATTASFSAAGVYVLRLEADDGMQIGEHRVFVNVLPTAGDPSLVGLWAFDGDATDDSGAENHGTLSGNPSYSSDAAPTGQPNSGSLSLNGSDSVVVAHDASLDATDAVTIAAWLKPSVSFPGFVANGGNDWAPIVKKGDTWWEENYWFGFGAYYYFFGRGLGAMLVPSLDDTMLTPNVWCHVAMTIDVPARRAKMFVNGVLDHMVQNVGALATNGDALYIGTKYQGLIDDVRIYSRALADDEIAALVPGAQINMPPVIDAGADEVIAPGDTLQLDGSYGDDAHPATSVISMWQRWDRAAGPGPITFANRFDLATTATFDEPGRYVLELTASDGAHVVRDTREILVDASAAGAGGAAGAPGNDDGSAGADEDAGCACRLHAHDSGSAPPMLLFAAAVGAMRRRRDLRS
jgi:hypothetical protein